MSCEASPEVGQGVVFRAIYTLDGALQDPETPGVVVHFWVWDELLDTVTEYVDGVDSAIVKTVNLGASPPVEQFDLSIAFPHEGTYSVTVQNVGAPAPQVAVASKRIRVYPRAAGG